MSAKKPKAEKIGSIPPFGLRMLPELKARIEEAAHNNRRSMNAEIIARLEESFSYFPAEHRPVDDREFVRVFHDERENFERLSRTIPHFEELLSEIQKTLESVREAQAEAKKAPKK